MTGRDDDIDGDNFGPLAAEYVLGTLDAEERAAVERRRNVEPAFDAAIAAWERRLHPLLESVEPATPRPELYAAIIARIGGARPVAGPAPEDVPAGRRSPRAEAAGTDVRKLRRRLAAWRAMAVAASLALAALVGALVYRPDLMMREPERYVAVFQDDDEAPRFLLSIDLASRELTVRPIAADPAPGRSYQLWIVAEELGPQPQSLGLLEGVDDLTQRSLGALAPEALVDATFGISLEPEGGSPTGQPTGPALHGTLIPTDTDLED